MLFFDTPVSDRTVSSRFLTAPRATRSLSSREFAWLFERERCLADRGERLFALVHVHGERARLSELERLSSLLCKSLRSTDAVGPRTGDRVVVLLPDTGEDGARIVAAWIDRAARSIGLGVRREIFIYPRVPTREGRSTGRFDPEPTPRAAAGTIGGRVVPSSDGRAHSGTQSTADPVAEPVEDLWPRLALPMPAWKRALDVLLSSLALAALLPVLLLVAIAIRLDSPGPVIFSQLRAGRGGRPFRFYKFRSMFVDAERRRNEVQFLNEKVGPIFKIREDPRITRVGRVLRRSSLDELPQLWNVLKGDVSLVGPRPPTLDEVAKYERWQLRRLDVAGGITCIWQVSGRSEIEFLDWMRMDMRYIARRSLLTDLSLLLRSVPAVLSGRGAY